MGLDQNLMRLPKGVNPKEPILSWDFIRSVEGDSVSLGYWRKCYDLDQRMEAVFLARGGVTEGGGRWSDVGLVLSLLDLEYLMDDILEGRLLDEDTDDGYIGSDLTDTLQAIVLAARAIRDGYTVYYTPSR